MKISRVGLTSSVRRRSFEEIKRTAQAKPKSFNRLDIKSHVSTFSSLQREINIPAKQPSQPRKTRGCATTVRLFALLYRRAGPLTSKETENSPSDCVVIVIIIISDRVNCPLNAKRGGVVMWCQLALVGVLLGSAIRLSFLSIVLIMSLSDSPFCSGFLGSSINDFRRARAEGGET